MNIKQAKEQIKNAMTAYFTRDELGNYAIPIEKQRPVLLIGPPGIGKTAIMEQVAAELGVGLVSYSMTHHTRQSALGLPFITHQDTPFRDMPGGTLELSLRMLAILRLMFPYALLPSTTALGTIDPSGRELGLQSGGNVVMPNLSPVKVREKYAIYDNKICTGEESAQCRSCLEMRIKSAGYRAVTDRGDVRRSMSAVNTED